jgi:hypothetical protein
MRPFSCALVSLSLSVAACSNSSLGQPGWLFDGGMDLPRPGWIFDGPGVDILVAVDAARDGARDGAPDAALDASSGVDGAPDGGAGCGTCPAGYSCGTSNGIAVCRNNATAIPLFSRIFVIVMENTSYSTLEGASSTVTPNLKALEAAWATGSNYHGGHRSDGSAAHPSLPNYLEMTSGSDLNVQCDCSPNSSDGTCNTTPIIGNCSLISSSCGCPQAATNLADQLNTASVSWKAYGEDMTTPCNTAATGGYVPRHVPFVYYNSIRGDATGCAAHVVDYGSFASDLGSFTTQFTFIAPNLTHDMHDPTFPLAGNTNLTNGDTWLGNTGLPPIFALDDFKPGGKGLLVIVWDEDDASGVLSSDSPIPIFVISQLAKMSHYVSTVDADHKALLATFEDGLGLPRLTTVMSTTPLTDFFPAN